MDSLLKQLVKVEAQLELIDEMTIDGLTLNEQFNLLYKSQQLITEQSYLLKQIKQTYIG